MTTTTEIQAELLTLSKCQPKPGETAEAFTQRVVKRVNALADANSDNWEQLSEAAQAWMNANTTADDRNDPLALLDLEAAMPAAEAPVRESVAEEATEEESADVVEKSVEANGKVKVKKADKVKFAKEVKTVKPKAEAKAKVESNGKRGRKPLGPDGDAKIRVVSKPPSREGSKRQEMFAKYRNGMTVNKAVEAGVPHAWIRWHAAEGWISLS
jgi:hypothetical protein